MNPARVSVIVSLLFVDATTALGQDLLAAAKRVSVASLDSTLPAVPLEKWLAELRGVPAYEISWEVNDCGEGADGRDAPTCVEAMLQLAGDSTAHASLVMIGDDGPRAKPVIWDLFVSANNSFTSFKTLRDWAAQVRRYRRSPRY